MASFKGGKVLLKPLYIVRKLHFDFDGKHRAAVVLRK